jgi:outer membrane protein assembly factor BamA
VKCWILHISCLLLLNRANAQQLVLALDPGERAAAVQALKGLEPVQVAFRSDSVHFLLGDSVALRQFKPRLMQHLHGRGFLLASLDSLSQHFSEQTGRLYLGPLLKWQNLKPSKDVPKAWLRAARYRQKRFENGTFSAEDLLQFQKKLLESAENNGYPFASIALDSVSITGKGDISAAIDVQTGRFFRFSTPKLQGDLRLPPRFLPNYLGIRPGTPYNRAQVLRIRDQLRGIPFLELNGNPSVTFIGDEAVVNIFAKKKKTSRFDFVIGLLPRPNDDAGRLLVTGALDAAFQNALNQGERFALSFERLRPETQKMNVEAAIPYLLGSDFGVEGRLNIFRRDSSWVDAQGDIGVQYLFQGNNSLRLLWENRSSTLQSIDSLSIIRDRKLPANLDYRQNGFGLELNLRHLDYPPNPRKGWQLQAKGVAGLLRILRNNQIEDLRDPQDSEFDFGTLYAQLPEEKSVRYRLELNAAAFIPLFQRSTLKLSFQSGTINSSEAIRINEQYRLGGNKRLRGFDEESLLATRFLVSTLEYRLLIGQNAYLAAFSDYGYIENITATTRLFFRPLGLGAGLNFETQAGIFGITMAVGRQNPALGIDFRAAKFHLGYVNLF